MNIIDKIAMELKLDKSYIYRIVSRSALYYKDFTIPKHNGGKRFVAQPSPELKTLQYWVLNNIFNKIAVSKAAYAYKKGDSIKKNAQVHSKSKFILHADILNFFPSIRPSYLNNILLENKKILEDLGLELDTSILEINNICFRHNTLCVGAVSSPAISNIIMCSFDNIILDYCKSNNYIYSRYADDIYISSNRYIDKGIISFLRSELSKMKLCINYSKTKFHSPKYRRKITGLIITEKSEITVGIERRAKIKKLIYDKLVYNKGNPNKIIGYLSFLKDIEPNTYNNYIIKYSKYCDGDIITELKKDNFYREIN